MVFGFILPFGRFMNNVFSTAYHWNPITGAMPFMAAVSAGKKIEAVEVCIKRFCWRNGFKISLRLSSTTRRKDMLGTKWKQEVVTLLT